jgi:hypothetical protein
VHHTTEAASSICLGLCGAPQGHQYEVQGGYCSQAVMSVGFDCWHMRAEKSSWTLHWDAGCKSQVG